MFHSDKNQSTYNPNKNLAKYHITEIIMRIMPTTSNLSPIFGTSLYIYPPTIINAMPPANIVEVNAPLTFNVIPFISIHPNLSSTMSLKTLWASLSGLAIVFR